MSGSDSLRTRDPAPQVKPLNCPKCGQPLHVHTSRADDDGNGQPELVYVYLCFLHGFFTFRNSKGLVEGL